MKANIQTLKGFRDFLPQDKRARDFIVSKLKAVFERFGFEPLETPTLEYADLLLGKYGTEADKLVFTFTDRGGREIGLRYDQTVPTARVLAQYQGKLPKYFRRYQIQNNFRAEKPQKGRYREFTQADIDIFGSTSPLADAEILAATYSAFKAVGYPQIQLKINDRRSLITAITPFSTNLVPVTTIVQSLDKLDKIGPTGVIEELVKKGLTATLADATLTTVNQTLLSPNLTDIISSTIALGVPEDVLQYSPTLARGLDYYTGLIFEIMLPIDNFSIGSFGGGGRYDNLIKQLGGPDIPAIGVAYGLDRMVEAALQLNLIPSLTQKAVLIGALDPASVTYALNTASQLRSQNIACEVFPSIEAPGKLVGYANKDQYPFVILIGSQEVADQTVTLKNMQSGEQKTDQLSNIISWLR